MSSKHSSRLNARRRRGAIYLCFYLISASATPGRAEVRADDATRHESITPETFEKEYVELKETKHLRATHNSETVDIVIDTYVKEIYNNHSYKIHIFSTEGEGRRYIIPFDQSDHSSKDFIGSALYDKCQGNEVRFKNFDGQIRILEIKPIWSDRHQAKYILSQLSFEDGSIPGVTKMYFSIVGEGQFTHQCKDEE